MICGTNYFLKNNVAVKSSPKQNIHYCIMLKEVNASIIYGKMQTLECQSCSVKKETDGKKDKYGNLVLRNEVDVKKNLRRCMLSQKFPHAIVKRVTKPIHLFVVKITWFAVMLLDALVMLHVKIITIYKMLIRKLMKILIFAKNDVSIMFVIFYHSSRYGETS